MKTYVFNLLKNHKFYTKKTKAHDFSNCFMTFHSIKYCFILNHDATIRHLNFPSPNRFSSINFKYLVIYHRLLSRTSSCFVSKEYVLLKHHLKAYLCISIFLLKHAAFYFC